MCEMITINTRESYADDIVHIAISEKDFHTMLQVADTFTQIWGFQFNSKKSQIMIIRTGVSNKEFFSRHILINIFQSYKKHVQRLSPINILGYIAISQRVMTT